MKPCNKCLENYWSFKKIDNIITATCQHCGNEVSFEKKKMHAGTLCRKCKTPVILKDIKFKESKLKKPYYFTAYYYCPKCRTRYLSEKYQVYNKDYKDKKNNQQILI